MQTLKFLHDNIGISKEGHLSFGGADTVKLAEKYGTPLYITDENKIRSNCREYKNAVYKYFGEDSLPLYASKALCYKDIYRILKSEGLGADVVSGGELYTALSVGFPAEKIYFHGNNKTREEIVYALDQNIGGFIVDNEDELLTIDEEAHKLGKMQDILLRVTPGIDCHTYEAVATGKVDSKFGVPIETGQAIEFVGKALSCKNVKVKGLHCHIGSMIFDKGPFTDSAKIMLDFALEIKNKYGFVCDKMNLGGGIGVRYVESDPVVTIDEIMHEIKDELDKLVSERGLKKPTFLFEMGRYVCAAAGMTLYTVGSVKTVNGYKNYVCIDGGMTDNPRFALYESKYTVYNASKPEEKDEFVADVAGRCCESGDLIGKDMRVQKFIKGDILAVCVTGAYNYTMSSNYNRVPRPAMVSVADGVDRLVIRRESYEDIVKNEL